MLDGEKENMISLLLLLLTIGGLFCFWRKQQKLTVLKIIKAIVIVIGIWYLFGFIFMFMFFKSVQLDSKKVFKGFIRQNIPEDINITEGKGGAWLDPSGYVIFSAYDNTVKNLFSDYLFSSNCTIKIHNEETDLRQNCGNLGNINLQKIPDLQCFYKFDNEKHLFKFAFWDKNNKKVFFKAYYK